MKHLTEKVYEAYKTLCFYQEFHISFTFITDKEDDKRIDFYLGNMFFFIRKQFSSPGEGASHYH